MHVASALIIDDNEADRVFIRRQLNKSGRYAYIFEAETGVQALQLFEDVRCAKNKHGDNFPPVVIFLDINMPVMDGFEFLEGYEKLRREDDTSVILMVTSSTLNSDRERANRFEMVQDFIAKPLTRERAIEIADRFGVEKNS